jgi:hypothetical protein
MKAKFYERLMTAAMIGCFVFASGELVLPTVICAACVYGCNRKLESYGKYQ